MRKHDGLWYPDTETRLCNGHARVRDVAEVLKYVPRKRVCIQAGGAVGAWPLELAKHFDKVYSFEPNQALYDCFMKNKIEASRAGQDTLNLNTYRMALWNHSGDGRMYDREGKPHNMGSWGVQVVAHEGADTFALCLVDELFQTKLDLLMLDVEGGEIPALEGAEQTIARCKPTIVVESKEACQQDAGYSLQQLFDYLESLGYRQVATIARDTVWQTKRKQSET